MSPKEIYYFLGKCLVVDEQPSLRQEILDQMNRPEFSWEQFVQVGSSHLVLPALYARLREAGLLHHLPEDLVSHLKEIHALNVERNNTLLRQIHGLHNLFRQSGIRSVFLKGSGALLENLYADSGERMLADIDILVSEQKFEAAVQLVIDSGYSHPPFLREKLHLMHHFPSLYKTGEAAKVEIHRIPVGQRQLVYLNLEDLQKGCFRPDKPDGPLIPGGRDQILINVIHNQLKDRGQYYANIPLRNIYEFYRLTRSYDLPDEEKLHPRMKLVMNNYMAVAEKLFAPSESFPVKNRIRTRFFLFRFELNKTSRNYHRAGKLFRTLLELLHSYLYILSKALTHKAYRSYLRINLSSPAWHRHHLAVIRKRF